MPAATILDQARENEVSQKYFQRSKTNNLLFGAKGIVAQNCLVETFLELVGDKKLERYGWMKTLRWFYLIRKIH